MEKNLKEKIIFREEPLIDREKERGFIKQWFEKTPKEMLWIYGPKSTGKTTIIEYIVENELFDDFKFLKSEKYNVKYINFRRKLFGNYESFINSMLFVDRNKISESLKMTINLGVFKVEYEDYEEVKAKRMDLFDLLFNQLKRIKKKKYFNI
jgi:AAA+ ATPase superfamily predicted ATPase